MSVSLYNSYFFKYRAVNVSVYMIFNHVKLALFCLTNTANMNLFKIEIQVLEIKCLAWTHIEFRPTKILFFI